MKKKIYLAGKIHGISYEEATQWRNLCKRRLSSDYDLLDPMEGKEFLQESNNIPILTELSPLNIFNQDIENVRRADIILANLNYLPVFGTPFELGYAFALGETKPLLLLGICSNEYYEHPFVAGSLDYIFKDADEACIWLDNFVGKDLEWA